MAVMGEGQVHQVGKPHEASVDRPMRTLRALSVWRRSYRPGSEREWLGHGDCQRNETQVK
jgi:hypothetical protein